MKCARILQAKKGESQVRLGALPDCDARLTLRKERAEVGGSVLDHCTI